MSSFRQQIHFQQKSIRNFQRVGLQKKTAQGQHRLLEFLIMVGGLCLLGSFINIKAVEMQTYYLPTILVDF